MLKKSSFYLSKTQFFTNHTDLLGRPIGQPPPPSVYIYISSVAKRIPSPQIHFKTDFSTNGATRSGEFFETSSAILSWTSKRRPVISWEKCLDLLINDG